MTRAKIITAIVIIVVAILGVYLAFQNTQSTSQSTSLTSTTRTVPTSSGTITSSSSTSPVSTSTTALTTTLPSSTTGSTTTSVSTSTTLTLSNSSVFNLCFVNGYDNNVTFINSIYYECSANLQPSQSIKQNVLGSAFSSPQLQGKYMVSINATYSVSVVIVENGSTVLNQSGTSINYTGNIASGGSMYFTITNEGTIVNTYEFGIDFPS